MLKERTIILIMCGLTTFITVLVLICSDVSSTSTKQLKFVHVIVRHGTRAPQSTYPLDPHINSTMAPSGWGHLTNPGKLETYNLGLFLRQRYDDFLGPKYDPLEYYTQSTDVDRTRASGQLINAGLWPPRDQQKWGPLDWQPIPVRAEPLSEDSLLLVRRPCPKYNEELDRVKNSSEIQSKLKSNAEIFKQLSKATGADVSDFDDVQDVFSTLLAEQTMNLTLPKWTEGLYPEPMKELTIFSFVLNSYNAPLKRLKGGVLLKKLLADWEAKTGENSDGKGKMVVYIGHDSTIVNIMQAIGAWEPQLPGYGIMVMLELWQDMQSKEFGVEVYLKNGTETYQLRIGGCDAFCVLPKLRALTKDVVPDNWNEECKSEDEYYQNLVVTKAP